MSREEIKSECELMYKVISDAQEKLKELRFNCKHEYTFKGDYSVDMKSTHLAVICSDCHSLIKYINE